MIHAFRSLVLLCFLSCCSILCAEDAKPQAVPDAQKSKPTDKDKEKKDSAPAEKVQPPLVVTADRIATPADETGVSITVLEGRDEKVVFQNNRLADSLRQVPGITVSQSGLPGDFTSVFTRGGNSNQTLFLFDGWKVNRQGGNFNLSAIDTVQLDRIEIARGPASSLFGTDAVTGAINVITDKGRGRPELTTSAAGGTFGTDRETLSMQGNEKKFSYNLGAARLHRDEATSNNSELETYNYAARFDFEFNKDHAIKAIIRGSDIHKGFYEDSGSGYGTAIEPPDPNDQIKTRDLLTGLEYKGHILPIWDTTLRIGHYLLDQRITSVEENPDSAAAGFAQSPGRTMTQERRPSLDWQNDITAYESEDRKIRNIVTVGTSVEQDRFNQDDTQFFNNVRIERTNWSVFAQNRLELFDRAFLTAGVRREQNGQFGGFTTARGDVSILIPESDSRIHGSVGNAFRTPSFFEFFSGFGNPDLKPEKNFAYDVGIEQHFWKKRITLGATWFNNDFDDLINFSFDSNTLENLKTANTRGFELMASIKPIKQVEIRWSGTLMHTEDDAGRRLLRRPGNKYTVQIIARPIENLDLSLDLNRTGSRSDLGPTDDNPFATVHNESFTRIDAAASYRFFEHWRAFGRVGNILNRSYEEVITFPSPGTTVLVGIEFNWRF